MSGFLDYVGSFWKSDDTLKKEAIHAGLANHVDTYLQYNHGDDNDGFMKGDTSPIVISKRNKIFIKVEPVSPTQTSNDDDHPDTMDNYAYKTERFSKIDIMTSSPDMNPITGADSIVVCDPKVRTTFFMEKMIEDVFGKLPDSPMKCDVEETFKTEYLSQNKSKHNGIYSLFPTCSTCGCNNAVGTGIFGSLNSC